MSTCAIIIVDHGSRRAESNAMLEAFVEQFAAASSHDIVEPAHMELAEPTIGQAFDSCVARGADSVVVMPYFLLPGRHWKNDIPNLTAAAAANHPGVSFLVTAPIGLHPLMGQVIESRIEQCLKHAAGETDGCDVCAGTADGCVMQGNAPKNI